VIGFQGEDYERSYVPDSAQEVLERWDMEAAHFESEKSWAGEYDGPWEHWLQMYMEGRVQRGDWADHVLSWWEHRDADNIFFLRYEDLREDFDATVARIAAFLDYPLPPELLATIREKTSFQVMKQDDFSNMHEIQELTQFFRRGQVGSWKDIFTDEQSERFDTWLRGRLDGTELEFRTSGEPDMG
jgi:hypothetical protein